MSDSLVSGVGDLPAQPCPEGQEIKVEFIVEGIVYTNDDTDFAVLRGTVGKENNLTAVGRIRDPKLGSVLSLKGKWVTNKRYGRQFSVSSWVEKMPSTERGMRIYLGSGLIKGIGKKLANLIVDKFGMKTPEIIRDHPEKLLEVSKIGKKRIGVIHESWMLRSGVNDVMMFLNEHGLSSTFALKIYKRYGDDAGRVIMENPYCLASDVWGIGFKMADRVAATFGFQDDHIFRCRSGVLYAMQQLSDNGNVFSSYQELMAESMEILGVKEEAVVNALNDLLKSKELVDDGGRIYLPYLYYAELDTADKLIKMSRKTCVGDITIEEAYEVGRSLGIEYDKLQAEAVSKASSSGIMVITGGPGTGKTTIVRGILACMRKLGKEVLLAAPTGRASKRMSEATGGEAKTIHRLLEYTPTGMFQRNKDNLLVGDALIVDECSMIDISLMRSLLCAVPDNMRVILVGDIDQLPSVGPGNVLGDIINSGMFPVVRLTHIFRQALGSNIIVNAHRVNKGMMPGKDNRDGSDFFFMERGSSQPEDIARLMVGLVTERLPAKYRVKPVDIQVLCPMRKGPIGVNTLNEMLQEVINPGEGGIKVNGMVYREGDKVMQLCNNYEKEVYNGDIGFIAGINEESREVVVDFNGNLLTYEFSELDELVLAYATTIHKAQGSEYNIVVMPLTTSHYVMLQRNLLYTGITRAKNIFVLVGSSKAVAMAVRTQRASKRHTFLKERLWAYRELDKAV